MEQNIFAQFNEWYFFGGPSPHECEFYRTHAATEEQAREKILASGKAEWCMPHHAEFTASSPSDAVYID